MDCRISTETLCTLDFSHIKRGVQQIVRTPTRRTNSISKTNKNAEISATILTHKREK